MRFVAGQGQDHAPNDQQFPLKATPWPAPGLRRASVNSFGFGGANSHAVLDDACHYLHRRNLTGRHRSVEHPPTIDAIADDYSDMKPDASVNGYAHPPSQAVSHMLENNTCGPRVTEGFQNWAENSHIGVFPKVLVWSAADEGGLNRLSAIYGQHFARLSLQQEEVEVYMENLAFTLSVRRSSLAWRSFTVASSLKQLHDVQINMFKPTRAVTNPKLGFVFTGQGAQWYAMGRELLAFYVFRDSVQEAELHFNSFGCQWSLLGMVPFLVIVYV